MILVTPYWEWIRNEAGLIGTDGCTGVTGTFVECCYEHDLSFVFAKDPRDAYRKMLDPDIAPGEHWQAAKDITFEESNTRFRVCNQSRSKLGAWSPLPWIRWVGVTIGGRAKWDEYRAKEQQQRIGDEVV